MAETASISPPRPLGLGKQKITYEDFLNTDWPNPHVEWVDGEVVEMSPVGRVHQSLGSWLISLMRSLIEARGCGEIEYHPFQMKLGANLPGRAPDILFVANENLHRLHETFLEGPADIAVEIVSPGSGGLDRGDKYLEYERGGVREYWLIDPQRSQAEFSRLGLDGYFHMVDVAAGVFRSDVLPGFWIKIEWLWADTRPSVLDVLKEWGLI